MAKPIDLSKLTARSFTYPNSVAKEIIDSKKMSGAELALARVPVSYDADVINLKIIFRTEAGLPENQEKKFLDKSNQPVTGIDVLAFADMIHTARASLNGLAALVKDKRVESVSFADPVFTARQP